MHTGLSPTASIVLDLGIPKFTTFSIKFPIPEETQAFQQVASEALGVMLDEMTAFMISVGYKKEVIAKIYALTLACYKDLVANDHPENREKDPSIGSVRGEFQIPADFINETQRYVVTAGKKVDRSPRQRRVEIVPKRPVNPSKNDVLKAIRRYRFQSIKSQPFPLYLVVYDNMGQPKGTLTLGPGFHNELLKMQYKKKGADQDPNQAYKDAVRAGGGVWKGIGENGLGGWMVYFDNAATRSTLTLDTTEVTPEAVAAKIKLNQDATDERRKKMAGQWGPRSYDGDSIHDILDRHRPGYDDVGDREHLGFDEPIPEEQLPSLYKEIEALDLSQPDMMQNYVGVVVFLIEHGTLVPDTLRHKAAELATALLTGTKGGGPGGADERGWKLWKDPEERKQRLREEIALLSKGSLAKEARFLRIDEMQAWGTGKQDEYYAQHPELGSPGKKLNLMVTEPDGTSTPLAKAVKADYGPDARRCPECGSSNVHTVPHVRGDVTHCDDCQHEAHTSWFKGAAVHPEYGDNTAAVEANRPLVAKTNLELAAKEGIETKGESLVLYHGTRSAIKIRNSGVFPIGTYFATTEKEAWQWALSASPQKNRAVVLKVLVPAGTVFPSGGGVRYFSTNEQIPYRPIGEPKTADYYDEQGFWAGEGGGASGILPVCTTTGRICFAWRSPEVQQGSCWGTIGGAIQRGMQPGESAKEELWEETGYSGGMTLHPAYVFQSGTFRYFNFIGETAQEFDFQPQSDAVWETEGLEWFTLPQVREYMAKSPHEFHSGVIALFKNSGKLIEQICAKAAPKKGKGDGKPSKVRESSTGKAPGAGGTA